MQWCEGTCGCGSNSYPASRSSGGDCSLDPFLQEKDKTKEDNEQRGERGEEEGMERGRRGKGEEKQTSRGPKVR